MIADHKSLASRIWFVVLLAVMLSSSLICVVSMIRSREMIRDATKQRMIDIANCASGLIDGDVLEKLTKEDEDTEEYKKIYDALAVFRDNIESEYVYGVRKEEDGRFTFTVDPALNDPGEFGAEVVTTPALIEASKGITAVDETPYSDSWGTFYSAYSPVFNSKGNVAGIVAVDFSREWFEGQQLEQMRKTMGIYALILIVTLIVVSAACFAQIRSITGPIREITDIARQYQKGDYSGNLEIERQDELGVLSRTLQSMATSLTEQIKVAETANRAKSDFLANMSHEIRTPINAMLGNNEMIYRESDRQEIRDYSSNVKSAGAQLLGLVDEILAYSKTGEKPDAGSAEKKESEKRYYRASGAKILAVDDNPMNLQVFLNLVKRTGVGVDTASSGDEGLKLAGENKYDVLVLDHMMPKKDGIETLAELRSDDDNPNISTPAVCLTANAVPGAREFYIGAGFDDYLTKPVDPDALEEILHRFIPAEKIEEYIPQKVKTEEPDTIPGELEMLRGGSFDIDAGIRINGSVGSYMTMLKMFQDSAADTVGELEGLYLEDDNENYTIKVHALKSSLRIIGATSLSEDAQRLEDAGKEGDREYIKDYHDRFISDVCALEEELSKAFAGSDEAEAQKSEADADTMKDLYKRLRRAADDMDCDGLEYAFELMSAYRIPESDADLYKKLKAASDRFEYAKILELLQNKG